MLLAAAARAEEPPTVTTHATARDRLANTVADVQLGIEAHGRAVADVRTALSAGSAPLTAFLHGVGAERIRTENVSVQPDFDYDPGQHRPPRVTGYTGRLSISFETPPDKLSSILADALTHGANTIDSTTLHPRASEVDAAHQRLAAAATRIAVDEAHAVAEAAGMKPGPARQITVEGVQSVLRARVLAAPIAPAPAASPPLTTEAGDSEINVTVTVAVTLVPP